MKDQLVDKSTAFMAKEKGFDWECRYYCDQLSIVMPIPSNRINDQKRMTDFVFVPTQAMLERWLREVHSLFVYVAFYKEDHYLVEVYKGSECISDIFHKETWELAHEEGLKQALKSIS